MSLLGRSPGDVPGAWRHGGALQIGRKMATLTRPLARLPFAELLRVNGLAPCQHFDEFFDLAGTSFCPFWYADSVQDCITIRTGKSLEHRCRDRAGRRRRGKIVRHRCRCLTCICGLPASIDPEAERLVVGQASRRRLRFLASTSQTPAEAPWLPSSHSCHAAVSATISSGRTDEAFTL